MSDCGSMKLPLDLQTKFDKCSQEYLNIFGSVLTEFTGLDWVELMAMKPFIELGTSNQKVKVGQVGRYSYNWEQPTEHDNDPKYLTIYTYVVGIKCEQCQGEGKIEPELLEQNYDLEKPPIYSDTMCNKCDGSGVYHDKNKKLNAIKLSEEDLFLQKKYTDYQTNLRDDFEYHADQYLPTNVVDSYSGYSNEHDEDNPESELDDLSEWK